MDNQKFNITNDALFGTGSGTLPRYESNFGKKTSYFQKSREQLQTTFLRGPALSASNLHLSNDITYK